MRRALAAIAMVLMLGAGAARGQVALQPAGPAELVIVFCLAAEPATCDEQHPLADLSLTACLIEGQLYASEWLAEHPKWQLQDWRCAQNVPKRRAL